MPDTGELGEYKDAISRRKMLALTGASGAAALAGCDGAGTTTQEGPGATATETATETTEEGGMTTEEGGDTTTEEATTTVNVHDATYINALGQNPSDRHFNRAATQNYSWQMGRSIFAPLQKYSFSDTSFHYGALENLEINPGDQEAVLTFRDDITWSNGRQFTTEDFAVQLRNDEKIGSSLWGYLESFDVVDDYTIRLNLSGPTNPDLLNFELGATWIDQPKEVFERFNDQEASAISQFEWHGEEYDVIGNAMWKYVTKSQQRAEFERFPEFYQAHNVNFSNFYLKSYGGNTAQQQALMQARDLDGAVSLFVPPDIVEQFPDKVEEINMPAKWGYGMAFNHEDDHYGQRKVRQAIAHLVNRQRLVDNAGPRTKFPAPIPCGIAPRDQEPWLGDWFSDFEDYGVDASQSDQAAQLLEDAGFSKDGGTWKDGNGNALGGDYFTPAGWTDWTTMTQTVVSQLQNFGLDISIATRPTGDWFNTYSQSNFSIGGFYWLPGQARSAFPYFPLRFQMWGTPIGGGHNYRPIAQSSQTVPARGGGEMTLDTPLEEANAIASQPDREAARPYVQRSAWYNHIDLPMLSLVSKFEQSWHTTDDWTVAPEGNPNRQVKWPHFWQVHEGTIQHK